MKTQINEIKRMQQLAGVINESQSLISEGKLINAKFYGFWQSEDGRKSGSPDIYIEANSEEEAKELANDYTEGQFTEFPGFYNLEPVKLNIYRKSV
jgi:hypothetical protein